MPWFVKKADRLNHNTQQQLMQRVIEEAFTRITSTPRRVLLLPPDITRAHSGAGRLTEMLYRQLAESCPVEVMPTLGQHVPHTPEQNRAMFASIPQDRFLIHHWRQNCTRLGTVPADFVQTVSSNRVNNPIPVEINAAITSGDYDLIINIGHVVPHEVLGFANHNKNYFIGLGGKPMICASHITAAACGIENNLGCLISPLRACYIKAERDYLADVPHLYIQLTLARDSDNKLALTGVFVGDDLDTYLQAAQQSLDQNVTLLDKPLKKVVAVMQPDEFHSTWVANKAIYRTRMAIADGGELLIIAPGLERFGEQPEVDAFIRKYGYTDTPTIMAEYQKNPEMQDLAHATAHLIHGSSENRFTITYAPGKLTRKDIESVNYNYAALDTVLQRYPIDKLAEGMNTTADGEEFYFIASPSAGLWSTRERIENRTSLNVDQQTGLPLADKPDPQIPD